MEMTEKHETLGTRAVRWKCLSCGKEPVGDHHAHRRHTQNRRFSARAQDICFPDLADIVDTVEVHLQQMQDCINTCFSEDSGDPRESMRRFADHKAQARRAWEDFLGNDWASALSERPFGSYPVATWAVLWPLTKKARGDMSSLVGYFRHLESVLH